MDILKKDKLGVRSIDSIKPSDAKEWAIRMSENGYAYQTINNYKRSLKASSILYKMIVFGRIHLTFN